MSDFHQYYTIATTTIFFYDFLLTLADEVSHVVSMPFHHTYWPDGCHINENDPSDSSQAH